MSTTGSGTGAHSTPGPAPDRARAPETAGDRDVWVLRHAKAAADSPDGEDHSRPLTKRGRAQAEAAAQFLGAIRDGGMSVPRLVLCSSAVRALQTAELVLPGLGTEVTLEVERGLYQADADEIVERLRQVEDQVPSVMVVGHNPAFADLVQLLVSDRGGEDRKRLESFPTCALAQFRMPYDAWRALVASSGYLERLFVPDV